MDRRSRVTRSFNFDGGYGSSPNIIGSYGSSPNLVSPYGSNNELSGSRLFSSRSSNSIAQTYGSQANLFNSLTSIPESPYSQQQFPIPPKNVKQKNRYPAVGAKSPQATPRQKGYYSEKKQGSDGIQRCVVTFVVISVILLLIGVAFGVYFGVFYGNENVVSIKGSVRIENYKWSAALLDKSSAEFNAMERQFCAELGSIVKKYGDTLKSCKVTTFRKGSVVVSFDLRIEVQNKVTLSKNQEAQAAESLTRGLIGAVNLRINSNEDITINDGNQCTPSSCPQGTVCRDLMFNFKCNCSEGKKLDPSSDVPKCLDIDECAQPVSPCSYKCENTDGSFICSCDSGYNLGPDRRSCQDNDECRDDSFNHDCEHVCVNKLGSYECTCNQGYTLQSDGKTCKDINECSGSSHGCEQDCLNTDGSYKCICKEGQFLWTDGKTCKKSFDSLNSQPIGVGELTVLDGSTTILGCSVPDKDPAIIQKIRWKGPNGDVVQTDKAHWKTNFTVAAQYSTYHQSVLLGFTNQLGEPTDVVPGKYTCYVTIGGFHVEKTITVQLSGCSKSDGYVMCTDRRHCIQSSKLCNAQQDCPSSADDELHHCPTPPAKTPLCDDPTKRVCGGRCISASLLCNGASDCNDGLDEYACGGTCNGHQCSDGGCIDSALLCDGNLDCKDGSDEKSCDCSGPNKYQCANGVCLSRTPSSVYCNAIPDCPDRSDEPAKCECLAGQYYCDSKCKPASIICDGDNDCQNGADENNCNCASGDFPCKNGRCIKSALLNNGFDDCNDNSDEMAKTCKTNEFECNSGKCIPVSRVGDSVNDCGDWDDEITQDCPSEFMHCANKVCLRQPKQQIFCDAHAHCPDGSDEPNDCKCLTETQHDCGEKCIPKEWLNDGQYDCPNKSDEPQIDLSCSSEDMFTCHTGGKCIPRAWKCDKYADCTDGSDELCNTKIESDAKCNEGMFKCTSGLCIRDLETCDGKNHCGDFSDETLSTCPACYENQFKCNNGMCIKKEEKCDGTRDCADGEDELNCKCSNGYLCPDGSCIATAWICDNAKDCKGGADEQNCGSCLSNQFQCNNYDCISEGQRCDGNNDCADSSDEFHCLQLTSQLGILVMKSGSKEAPVCSTRWQVRWGNDVCAALGKGRMTSSSVASVTTNDKGLFTSKQSSSSNYKQGEFLHSSTCESGQVVTVNCEPLSCGLQLSLPSSPSPYIAKGQNADQGAWPWQVAMYLSNQIICGASIINHRWVVTAAHCLKNKLDNPSIWSFKMGSIYRSQKGNGALSITAEQIHLHPNYNEDIINYDIAVIKLSTPIIYTDYIQPICLHDHSQDTATFEECYTTGWGLDAKTFDKPTANKPEVLQEAKVRIISRERCNSAQTIEGMDIIDSTMVCAGFIDGFTSSCSGDSGGPLTCRDPNNVWSLVGITSWGNGQCSTYSVYTRVSTFKDWILQIIEKNGS